MRIGDAAAAAGTTPRALRFYEQRGLLHPPARSASGQREYGPAEVARVRVIRRLLAVGLTVDDLASRVHRLDLLGQDPPVRCSDSPGPDTLAPVVHARLATLDAEIARLTALRAKLAHHIATGGGEVPGEADGAPAHSPSIRPSPSDFSSSVQALRSTRIRPVAGEPSPPPVSAASRGGELQRRLARAGGPAETDAALQPHGH
ncbi:MerR family transcriptional regulator [Kitasatospora sp. NPDC057542]|uniref:MerR family transcriptional regulator n=1 Tax=Kitasatospora sp. NPDC057542 TaxID=3346162 RepID=UPI00369EE716